MSSDSPFSQRTEFLRASLQAAVPLHVLELVRVPIDDVLEEGRRCAQVVAEKGDVIMFRGKKKGETAKAFNALARGVACASFMPGGIKVFGDRYENTHPDQEKTR